MSIRKQIVYYTPYNYSRLTLLFCRDNQHLVVTEGSCMMKQRKDISRCLAPLKRRLNLRIGCLGRHPQYLEYMVQIQKEILCPRKQLHSESAASLFQARHGPLQCRLNIWVNFWGSIGPVYKKRCNVTGHEFLVYDFARFCYRHLCLTKIHI